MFLGSLNVRHQKIVHKKCQVYEWVPAKTTTFEPQNEIEKIRLRV
jgi:hypothetical protein